MSSVVVEVVALTARFSVQVASLASRHGQITVRAAFFCSPRSIPTKSLPKRFAILSPNRGSSLPAALHWIFRERKCGEFWCAWQLEC